MRTEKLCPMCKIVKPASEFYQSGKYLSSYCKPCQSISNKKYMIENSEKVSKRASAHRKANIEKYLSSERKYHNDPGNIHRQWATSSINNHKKKGINVDISIKELTDLVKPIVYCPICGVELKWFYGKLSPNSPSLDRIIPDQGISLDNIQIMCHMCNTTKHTRTMKQFVEYCKMIVEKFG